ncbi:MAG TPA: response regulator [Burkholderiales bacterium]|nr:response regulator [Burkholderiales bacterium]
MPEARLLIVDDEVAQMTALCDTLGDEGYSAAGFSSANEALASLREQRFDLLLTDLMMPEMDGIALLRAAQEIDPHLAGIVMTGHGTIDTAIEAMKAGALDYILKPFKLSVILPVLSRALDIRRLRMENAVLERSVRERTAELEAANRELEAFSYSVSHDLRAPLRAVNGFSNILLEDYLAQLPAEAQRLLNQVSIHAGRMGQLIDDLLRFSRLSRQPLSPQPVNVAALVGEALEGFGTEREGRRIEIHVGPLPDAVGDPALLRQVFVNLLSNALKFTRQRDPAVIEVGCRQQDADRIYYVRDNGTGFDMQYADKLFGVFQRLHGDQQFEGTGVGLSIVQRIVARHGGRIWAEAQVDQGAVFYFTLPA